MPEKEEKNIAVCSNILRSRIKNTRLRISIKWQFKIPSTVICSKARGATISGTAGIYIEAIMAGSRLFGAITRTYKI